MKQTYIFCILFVSLFSSAQIVNIPDANFKAKLLSASSSNQIAKNLSGVYFKIDTNSDNEIQNTEALNVSYLNLECPSCVLSSKINSMDGIEFFTNLSKLFCNNNNISNINLTNLNQLTELGVEGNQITTLNLNNLTQLFNLGCSHNQIQNLDVSYLTNLSRLDCSYNLLTSLDLSNNIGIDNVYCNNNQLNNINLQNLNSIGVLCVQFNQLTEINLTGITTINGLLCYNNLLTTLYLNDQYNLSSLQCQNNQLTSLYVKNNKAEGNIVYPLNFSNNPNLQFICCDELEESGYNSMAINYGYSNCSVSSYCTFTPGGIFYTIQGNQKFDNDNNGCTINDIVIPNLKYTINNGSSSGTIISNSSGSYSIPVTSGSYLITPILENPNYFIVSPNSLNVNIPSATNPYIQNFCITANGVFNDLEIIILPLGVARPGFDARYNIIYKNKGTTTQSGTIDFTFNDTTLDFVSANPTVANQLTNLLNWNFTNLLPFESRTIEVVFNLNSPLETPALNSGDILNYTATINGSTDETPNNNTFILNQAVVNSYDPNDKTCLQGNTITPDKVGEYVHYTIRFENTGNFPAENIVVKDMIDTTKFNVSSLIPLHASHNYVTRIKDSKVEFIFENINLPFDDANNDGYIAFKIKTLPSLVVGNTFSNSANIYFDYNFPIVTNTATTTIAALSNPSFEFSNYFNLYPNPTTNELNINLKSAIEINSIQIYNTIGQLVTVQTGNALKVDVSNLKTGNYFIKINTNEGFSTSQFIKE